MNRTFIVLCVLTGCLFWQLCRAEPVIESDNQVHDSAVLLHWLEGWYDSYSRTLEPEELDELAPFGLVTHHELKAVTDYLITGRVREPLRLVDNFLQLEGVQIRSTVHNHKLFLRELYRRRQFGPLRKIAFAEDTPENHVDKVALETAAVFLTWMYEDSGGWSFTGTMSKLAQSPNPKVRYAVLRAYAHTGGDHNSLDILINLANDRSPLTVTQRDGSLVSYGPALREMALMVFKQHALTHEILWDLLGPQSSSEPAVSCYDLITSH